VPEPFSSAFGPPPQEHWRYESFSSSYDPSTIIDKRKKYACIEKEIYMYKKNLDGPHY
jgi:hypothetical protein